MHELEESRRQGLSIQAISNMTGFDRETVRKYLTQILRLTGALLNASLTEIVVHKGGPRLVTFNTTPQLAEAWLRSFR